MEQALTEILKQGITGAIAVFFIYLYMKERSDHETTRQKLIESLGLRLEDSKQNMDKVTTPLSTISQGIEMLSDKIEAKRGKR